MIENLAIWACPKCGKTTSLDVSPGRCYSYMPMLRCMHYEPIHYDEGYFLGNVLHCPIEYQMVPLTELAKSWDAYFENLAKNPPPSRERARMFMNQVNW